MEVGSSQKKLKNKIKNLPDGCGVYIFKDKEGNVIYVGKAKSLKKRVQSYFSRFQSFKTQVLVFKIADIAYILTSSESQARLLEDSLIKDKLPIYNISLRDDKSFPWIRITREDFPLVSISRRKTKDKPDNAEYFGPYTNVKELRQAFKLMRRIFGFRSCKTLIPKLCLYWRLKLCPGPCAGNITRKKYQEIIKQIKLFLGSRYEELLSGLSAKMKQVAQKKRFEEAARIRDQISALSVFSQTKGSELPLNELQDLKRTLKLEKLPERIEAFDISDISGREATGSMVSFYKGLPDKNNYRRFRIKTFTGIDDYKMLKEVVSRRYTRLVRENLTLPDLVLIDGGRGHLESAAQELRKLAIELPLASIAKDRENIYTRNSAQPINLNQDTLALNLIRRIRDEAHRFAISYHHILRRKKIIGR